MVTIALALVACGVGPEESALLERIVEVESKGEVYALHLNGALELERQPRDREEAVATARWLLAEGKSFDAGLGQVNSQNFARLGLTAESAFDSCPNLRAAEQVLKECRRRARDRFGEGAPALAAALSCYNTGHLGRGVRNGYVDAVLGARFFQSREPPPSAGTSRTRKSGGEAGGGDLDVFASRPRDAFGSALEVASVHHTAGKESER